MSSATSTKMLPAKAGSYREPADDGFRVSHFFVLVSLVAATIAVVMARPAAPENLILISLTIGAAGLAAVAFYRTIAPLLTPGYEEEREPLSARPISMQRSFRYFIMRRSLSFQSNVMRSSGRP